MAVSKEKFVLVQNNLQEAEKITTKSISFWQDALRRLKENKIAMFGFWIIVIITLLAILGPMQPIVPDNADGSPFTYDAAPILNDENGKELPKSKIAFLPPRVPGLEKLGIFDGTTKLEITTYDLLIGNLPKTDEFKELKLPSKKKELTEKLGIRYYPYDISIKKIYKNKQGEYTAKIVEINTNKELEVPYKELVSKYSRYQENSFKYISTKMDDQQVEMIKVKADFYEMKNVKNLYFWFGTDKLGLDVWTRLWIGVRVSLIIALASLILDFTIGIIYGTIAGFYAGTKVDNIMMRFLEIIGSIPSVVFMIILISIKGKIEQLISSLIPFKIEYVTIRLIILIFAMSITGWIGVARVVRAQVLKLRSQEFVLASRTLGASNVRLMAKHLFPNIIGQLMVMATFTIPNAIFNEAFLTFIGIGLPIPMSSLGVLVYDGYNSIQTIPTMLFIPASVMCLLMLSINFFANGLRDALDPRMR